MIVRLHAGLANVGVDFGLAEGMFPIVLLIRIPADSMRQIKFNLMDCGIRGRVGLHSVRCSPLPKLSAAFGPEADVSTSIPQGIALRAPHEWPPLFASTIPTRVGASRTM